MAKKKTKSKAKGRKKKARGKNASSRRSGADDALVAEVVEDEEGDFDGEEGEEDEDAEPGDDEIGDADLDADVDVDDRSLERIAKKSTKSKSSGSKTALSLKDPFQAYIREVQRYPLLTREQEKELTTKYYETQDPEIARRLVTANLRLVIKLAYEYRRAYKNMMDLIQEGNIGLMQAVKRYDPYRGVKLSSYSAWWIRAYMLRFILNNWRLVKLGTTQAQRKLFFNLNKQKAKLTAMGIDPTPKLIAEQAWV